MTLEQLIRQEVADRYHFELQRQPAPTGNFSVWTVYVDELAMGLPIYRVYFVAPDGRSALRMPFETNRKSCAWSADSRYAALHAGTGFCLWDTVADRIALHAIEGALNYEIAFDAPAQLRAKLDFGSYRYNQRPKTVALDIAALDWRVPDPAERLRVRAAG